MKDQQEDLIEATVGKIVNRKQGSYLVAYPKKRVSYGSIAITCSLKNWRDTRSPEKGQVILLANVREFVNGWRASHAKPKKLTE